MKIQDLFKLILKYETDVAERELKYLLIKYIQKHATEVKELLENARELVDTVSDMFDEDIDYLNDLLQDILNYPEVIIEHAPDCKQEFEPTKTEKKLTCVIWISTLSLCVSFLNLIALCNKRSV